MTKALEDILEAELIDTGTGIGTVGVLPVTIGAPVVGGTEKSVLFVGAGPVLAQDNTHFAYDSAAKSLGLLLDTDLRFTPTNAGSDSAKAIMRISPAADGVNPVTPWSMYQLRALFGATYDHSLGMGWNVQQGYDPTQGSCFVLMEHNFDSTAGAGPILDEMHWSMRAPGGPEIRAWTSTVNWTTGEVRGAHFLDNLQFQLPDSSRIALIDSTGVSIFFGRDLFLTNSATSLKRALSFGAGTTLLLSDPSTQLDVKSNQTIFDNDVTVGDASAATHTLTVQGNSGKSLRALVAAGNAQIVADQTLLVSADAGAHYPLLIAGNAVVINAATFTIGTSGGVNIDFTVSDIDAAGGADGDLHIRKAGADTKMQLNVNSVWKTVVLV